MATVCVQNRGNDTSDYLKQLPDCLSSPSTPTPYNMVPILVGWGLVALIVVCITAGIIYAVRADYKKSVNKELVTKNVPQIVQRMNKIDATVERLLKLDTDQRLKKLETYYGGSV